ncbi:MAG TPA: Crp/Fnr family transcriptional regulator [Gemmatimonadaceae bacterium]|nr:Crp/Fnr family transcriptional regulator [Gemmatimonadaceae bacterium]
MDPAPAGEPRSPNKLLAALPDAAYEALRPSLERVRLQLKEVLFDVDQPIAYAYFPETSLVSVLGLARDGAAVETATIGREGVVGLPLLFGTDRTPAQAFCQIQGDAVRVEAGAFCRLLEEQNALRAILGRYAQALFTLVAQSSACNRLHPARQRCARWLLLTHDRIDRDELALTHQFLSQMLGVRRATVSEVAGELQADGVIECSYGKITVRDRARLEHASCECYGVIRHEFARLLDGRVLDHPLAGMRSSEGGKTTVGDGEPREPSPAASRDQA